MDMNQSFMIRVTSGPSKPGTSPKLTLMPIIQNKSRRIVPKQVICICCLIQTGSLLRLATCKHVELLLCIVDTVVEYDDKFICKYCHDILVKFSLFREQVNENIPTLLNGGLIKMNKKVLNMRMTHHPLIEIAQTLPENEDPVHSQVEIKLEPIDDDIPTDNIKLEPDFEMNIPLYAIKSELPAQKNVIPMQHQPIIQPVKAIPIEKVISTIQQKQIIQPVSNIPIQNLMSVVQEPQSIAVRMQGTQFPEVILQPTISNVTNTIEPFNARQFLDVKKKEMEKKRLEEQQKAYVNARYVEQEKFEGKIRMVNLTVEEMKAEREKDKKRPTYVNLKYKCHDCFAGFDHEVKYKAHMEAKHSQSGHVCVVCKCWYKTDTLMRTHCQSVHYSRYECVACGAWYKNIRQAVIHYNATHEKIEETFECTKCEFVTDEFVKMRSHWGTHVEPVECSYCTKSFKNKSSLSEHILYSHKKSKLKKEYSCKSCPKKFDRYHILTAHIKNVHNRGSPAYCNDCNKLYCSEASLESHRKRSHTSSAAGQELKFECDYCHKKFVNKYGVKQHIYFEHLKIIQNRCPVCDKNFKFERMLKIHVDFVHNKKKLPRSHICDQCGKAFKSSTMLRNHMRVHSGERPFKCVNCPATFSHNGARYTHNRLKHKVRGATTKVDQGD